MHDILADFLAPHLGENPEIIIEKLNSPKNQVYITEGMSEDEFSNFSRFRKSRLYTMLPMWLW